MRQLQQHRAHPLSIHSRWESDRRSLTADLRFHLLFQMITAFPPMRVRLRVPVGSIGAF
jgi:hypothetical protein